jgi:hypothetical protein
LTVIRCYLKRETLDNFFIRKWGGNRGDV